VPPDKIRAVPAASNPTVSANVLGLIYDLAMDNACYPGLTSKRPLTGRDVRYLYSNYRRLYSRRHFSRTIGRLTRIGDRRHRIGVHSEIKETAPRGIHDDADRPIGRFTGDAG